ncbi:UDP-N-acetylmuramate--L-alanine ligase [bacterium]|nr:UDP-N-acetylmuramate--L-alanine ligase [bacterium]|tara:strand:+ start:4156 stop:5448 length:1293 start_codon:yes stop_codon:yes gene_type:complete
MEKKNKIHFIGIGGIGMSGLARYYLHEGWQVSGSDINKTPNSEKLIAEGAQVAYEHSQTIIYDSQPELVVYTEGVTPETEGWAELEAARAAGIETINYFEALGRVANEYYLIAVAGTHGKTTTTAMLADILEEASYDPTVIVGSLRSKTGSNYRAGQSKYAVVEACEFKRDFLHLEPDVLVITNLEHEHVDYYKDLADVQSAFAELVAKVPEDGYIIADTKDSNVAPVLANAKATVINYTEYLNLERDLLQPGLHNRQNAAAAEAAASAIQIEERYSDEALRNFIGTARRFEYKGEVHNAPVYDDYAHHPTEVAAAIAGAREVHPSKQLTVVFQSHTYSRTKALFDEFVSALTKADRVLLLPIYAARETDDGSVSSEMLRDALLERGVEVALFHTIEAVALEVTETASSNDVVLCVGAGNVTKVSEILTK